MTARGPKRPSPLKRLAARWFGWASEEERWALLLLALLLLLGLTARTLYLRSRTAEDVSWEQTEDEE